MEKDAEIFNAQDQPLPLVRPVRRVLQAISGLPHLFQGIGF
jgi:hypothetical protein